MVLKHRLLDNVDPLPKVCTNSRCESSGRSVGGTTTY